MKKLIYLIIVSALIFALAAVIFAAKYPSSGESVADGSTILTGEIIGEERGWDGLYSSGSQSAFDGKRETYYDPTTAGDEKCYCGIALDTRYILTKVCIFPRDGQLARYEGASIQGSFDGEEWFTLFESVSAAVSLDWCVITEFTNNVGYSYYRYFNTVNHGDVAEVELYGYAGALSEDPTASSGTYKVGELTLLYDPQNGEPIVKQSAVFGGMYPDADFTPEKEGFVFGGWYLYPEGGEKITAETKVTRFNSHTLYARWITFEQAASIVYETGAVEAEADKSAATVSPVRYICLAVMVVSVAVSACYILLTRKKYKQNTVQHS